MQPNFQWRCATCGHHADVKPGLCPTCGARPGPPTVAERWNRDHPGDPMLAAVSGRHRLGPSARSSRSPPRMGRASNRSRSPFAIVSLMAGILLGSTLWATGAFDSGPKTSRPSSTAAKSRSREPPAFDRAHQAETETAGGYRPSRRASRIRRTSVLDRLPARLDRQGRRGTSTVGDRYNDHRSRRSTHDVARRRHRQSGDNRSDHGRTAGDRRRRATTGLPSARPDQCDRSQVAPPCAGSFWSPRPGCRYTRRTCSSPHAAAPVSRCSPPLRQTPTKSSPSASQRCAARSSRPDINTAIAPLVCLRRVRATEGRRATVLRPDREGGRTGPDVFSDARCVPGQDN